jgi:hypothetical protein
MMSIRAVSRAVRLAEQAVGGEEERDGGGAAAQAVAQSVESRAVGLAPADREVEEHMLERDEHLLVNRVLEDGAELIEYRVLEPRRIPRVRGPDGDGPVARQPGVVAGHQFAHLGEHPLAALVGLTVGCRAGARGPHQHEPGQHGEHRTRNGNAPADFVPVLSRFGTRTTGNAPERP